MPELTKSGKVIAMMSAEPERLFTPTGVGQALGLPAGEAQSLLEDLESEGYIEAIEWGRHALQRTRFRWVGK